MIVAGLRSRLGASNRILTLVAGPEQRLATHMSEADVAGFLSAFASAAEPVEVHFLWRPQLADPADELVLEAAVNGQAQATYPLKLPTSVKKAAVELAASDGVSLNQFIAAAVAEKVGSLRTARDNFA